MEGSAQRWLPAALLAGVAYPTVGIGFALLDSASGPAQIRVWRLAAWLVSGLVFGAHLFFEQRRSLATLFRVATHSATAVALGAFLLAVWVLVHGHLHGAEPPSPRAPLALIVFPLVTGIPSFVVGLAIAALAAKSRHAN